VVRERCVRVRTGEDFVEVLGEGAHLLHGEGVGRAAGALLSPELAAHGASASVGAAATATDGTGRRSTAAGRRGAATNHRSARRWGSATSGRLLARSLRVARLLVLLLRRLLRRLLELTRRVVAARRRRGRLRGAKKNVTGKSLVQASKARDWEERRWPYLIRTSGRLLAPTALSLTLSGRSVPA
jgi:hypothetical protein